MVRVVKDGGRVVFGDEGVAPWLRETPYGKMVICNNPFWGANPPIELLPFEAVNVSLEWVLENCFYIIEFDKSLRGPSIDPDVRHLGRRGGSMRSRYYGQLEGVDLKLKDSIIEAAKNDGVSVVDWLEAALLKAIASPKFRDSK
jgi:hypothetical protein